MGELTKGTLLLVDSFGEVAEPLKKALVPFGYVLRVIANIENLEREVKSLSPQCVLLYFPDTKKVYTGHLRIIRHVLNLERPPEIIVLSDPTALAFRLELLRLGVTGFVALPFDISTAIDCVYKIAPRNDELPIRVMIIDDDRLLTQLYEAVLKAAGMEVSIVNDPFDTLDVLNEARPELILLDYYMPEIEGRELAKLLRQETMYDSIPIVFLSAEEDNEIQHRAMRIGGDDFLVKSISPYDLIRAISSRAKRFRALRATMLHDNLTGLLHHTAIKERINVEISRLHRQEGHLSIALIDLDYFKHVNDTYGHLAGDNVLKTLSHMLRQRLRVVDILGRYGGEEFLICLPDTASEDARKVMEDLRESFAAVDHRAEDDSFRCTFSCGIASLRRENDHGQNLIEIADKALYQAKTQGRNCVVTDKDKII